MHHGPDNLGCVRGCCFGVGARRDVRATLLLLLPAPEQVPMPGVLQPRADKLERDRDDDSDDPDFQLPPRRITQNRRVRDLDHANPVEPPAAEVKRHDKVLRRVRPVPDGVPCRRRVRDRIRLPRFDVNPTLGVRKR
eukprot:1212297-Rhodomonas_salina.1